MPNKHAAIKSLRQDKKKHDRNAGVKTELRTLTKKVRATLKENKRDEADSLLRKLESKLSRAAKNNIIKKGNASRRISRLRAEFSKATT